MGTWNQEKQQELLQLFRIIQQSSIPFIILQTIGTMEWFGMEGTRPRIRAQRGSFPKILVQLQKSLTPCCGFLDLFCPGFLAHLPPGSRSRAGSEPCRALQSCEFRCCTWGRKHQINSLEQHKRHVKLNHRLLFMPEQDGNIFFLALSSQTFRKGFFFLVVFFFPSIKSRLI